MSCCFRRNKTRPGNRLENGKNRGRSVTRRD